MAATNFTPIQLYFSTTASAVPLAANLAQGELAINITDGKLYYEDNGGVVQVIATKGAGTIGGSTTQIQYNNAGALAGSASMTFNSGTSTTTLTTLNLTNALGAIYGGTSQSAYTQGDILYSSATNTLAKLGIGTVNYILTSSGSVPQWVAPTSIVVQTANNLSGGLAGSVPYQSALDTTTFLAIGAANRVMTSTGSAPQWVTALTGLTGVSSSSITNTSLTATRLVYSSTAGLQTDSANLTFDGTTLSAAGYSTTGLSTLVKTVTIGNSNFNGTAVFAAATPAKLYIGTGTVTDTTSAIGATNATGAISSLAITPIAASNTSVTYTNASTLYIAGAPSAGTNVTITNPYSLYIAAGASYFGGNVTFANQPIYSGGTANGVMYLNGSKQVTTGTALTFDGNSTLGVAGSGGRGVNLVGGGTGNIQIAGDGSTYSVGVGFYNNYASIGTAMTGVWAYGSAGVYQYMSLGGSAYNNGAIYIDSNKKVGISKLPSAYLDVYNNTVMPSASSTSLGFTAAVTQGTGTLAMAAGSGNQRGNLVTIYGAQGSPTTTLPYGQDYDTLGLTVAMDVAAGGGYSVRGISSYVRSDGQGYAFQANVANTSASVGTTAIGFYANSIAGANINYGFYQNGSSTYNFFNGWVGVGANSTPYGNTTNERMTIEGNVNGRSWLSIRNTNSGSSALSGVVLNAYGNSWALEMGSAANNSNALNITKDIYGAQQVMAYMQTSGIMTFYGNNNNRPVQIGDGGSITIQGESGGWQVGTFFKGSAGTTVSGFGTIGQNDALTYSFVGPIYSNTFARFTGNGIGLGNTSPATSGTGITFPATQDASSGANTLDDYEEGTWSPVLRGSGTAGSYTLTYDTNGTNYTKVGRLVTVNCMFVVTTVVSGGTGYAQITGLPFANSGQQSGSCYFANVTVDALTLWCDVEFISANGQTIVYFNSIRNSQSSLDTAISGFAQGCSVRFTLTYTTST
jgi:hypothetical protein